MSATKILEIIKTYIDQKGSKLDIKKKFAEYLNEYIDFRIEAVLNEKQTIINKTNVTLLDKPADIAYILDTLAIVPKPPNNDTDIDLWIIAYIDWYETYYSKIINLTDYNYDTLSEGNKIID